MVGLHLLAEDLRGKEMFVACNDLCLLLKRAPTSLRGKEKGTHAWHGRIVTCKFCMVEFFQFLMN